jgi:hypothetical protein
MSVLILQIIIKQWDKSQRTNAHVQLRANQADRFPLNFPPAFYALNQQCVIDQHGDDIQGNRLKFSLAANGSLLFDRFQISLANNSLTYLGANSTISPQELGNLDNQWLQYHYNWRYSIFESDRYYWLYEEVTLNAIHLKQLDELNFFNTKPAIIYNDISELDAIRKQT